MKHSFRAPRKPKRKRVRPVGERRYRTKAGYWKIYMGKSHPMGSNDGYIFEHRLIMMQHLGRDLRSTEIVHHRNGNRADNRIENLEIMSRAQHAAHHNPDRRGRRYITSRRRRASGS